MVFISGVSSIASIPSNDRVQTDLRQGIRQIINVLQNPMDLRQIMDSTMQLRGSNLSNDIQLLGQGAQGGSSEDLTMYNNWQLMFSTLDPSSQQALQNIMQACPNGDIRGSLQALSDLPYGNHLMSSLQDFLRQ